MFGSSSRIDRIERLLRDVDRSACPTHPLVSAILAETCPRYATGSDAGSLQLRHWLETDAFTEIGFALIEQELPGWCLRRLASDDGLWWCALTPRAAASWGNDEVDESHEDMALAILKAFLTALCHLLPEARALPPAPALIGRAETRPHWW